MGELAGALVVATSLLAVVVRDVLVVHARVLRSLESRQGLDADVVADAAGPGGVVGASPRR